MDGEGELPGDHFFDGVGVVFTFCLQFFVFGEDLFFRLFEHAIEAAQHGKRDHDAAVLGRAVWAAQEIGDVPDYVAIGF